MRNTYKVDTSTWLHTAERRETAADANVDIITIDQSLPGVIRTSLPVGLAFSLHCSTLFVSLTVAEFGSMCLCEGYRCLARQSNSYVNTCTSCMVTN